MTNISAGMVKDLRDKTGAGMMDCKQALVESNGNMESAIEWLRKKGLSKAAKKSDRIASQGLIAFQSQENKGAIVEVNSETDFVARNPQFQEIVRNIAKVALLTNGDYQKLLQSPYPSTKNTIDTHIKEAIATIGENITLRRSAFLNVSEGIVAAYMHNKISDDLGKIGVLVALESNSDKNKLHEFGRQIAMHIAAASPLSVSQADLDPSVIEKEKAFYHEQAATSGKPKDIIEKMVEGRLKKEFFQQVCLLNQVFVLDGKITVEEALKAFEKEHGTNLKIKAFIRFALGEGIEKKQEDFAAEVAKTLGAARSHP
ncbi:MAG: translation elongation factor Ts [Hyphomicrobium sp.]